MNTLYDSESFAVTHMLANAAELQAQAEEQGKATPDAHPMPLMARHGFEIIDKRSGKELYLDGSWAEMFQRQILAWQANTPTQEEVETTLDGYASLAQNPLVMH